MKKLFLTTLILVAASVAFAQQLNVIPQPVSVTWGKGVCATSSVQSSIDKSMPQTDAYIISITKKGIEIKAQNEAGLQYAHETLTQLKAQFGDQLPLMTIEDYPQYQWRGLMLDCSRHFYTLEYLKKQVDMLAHYKMNHLHLHLTDDQGWRMEIKRYPELTQQGAWREFNQQDSICLREYADQPEYQLDSRFIIHHGGKTLYGGFYTQEQLRDLVKYAAERHVEIIPEVDMPGHTQAISALYPQFTATGEASWGTVFSVPLSPAKEEVYTFMQNILDEVMDIFPSHYIHIGADEVEKDTWKKSDECRALMEREGFTTYEALQSYFVNRIHDYITSKGREMICWDDALEGGDYKSNDGGVLNKSVDIMYWRYWVGGVPQKVTELGHHIIFTPGAPMYIAHEGPVYDIYHFDAFKNVAPELKHLVRGGQVSLWGEGMSNAMLADTRIYPRLVALAERLWTPDEQRNWKSFKQRMEREKQWLSDHGVAMQRTLSTLNAMQQTNLDKHCMQVLFDSEYADPDIRYTLDGTEPTMNSKKFNDKPVEITAPVDMKAAIMIDGVPQKPMFERHIEYHKAVGAKVEYTKRRWYESYKAAEVATFTDGKRGSHTGFGDGLWQGFTGSFEVIVDLGEAQDLHDFTMTFIQDCGPGVYFPGNVTVETSLDGTNYSAPVVISHDFPSDKQGVYVKDFTTPLTTKARYLRVNAANVTGGFIFADEIVIH